MTHGFSSPSVPDPSGQVSRESIEGQLMAHRKILSLILAHLQRSGGADDLMAALDTLSVMQDHQEDPGAVIGGAEAIEAALAQALADVVQGAVPFDAVGNPTGG